MQAGYVDFELDLPDALLTRLVAVLDSMKAASMVTRNVSSIPEEQGVYQLFFKDKLVYIGKTDAEAGLAKRLSRHFSKLQHRLELKPAEVSFKAVRVYVFTAVDLETQLIKHYGGQREVAWNGSGFGSNDPGRERDTSKYKETHFDSMFSIDIEREIDIDLSSAKTATDIFSRLKTELPYTFRYQNASPNSRKPHPDFDSTLIDRDLIKSLTAKPIIQEVVSQLPKGWKATMLPSHIILYKNDSRNFPYGTELARSS